MKIPLTSTSFPALCLIQHFEVPENVQGDVYHISFWTRRLLLSANPDSVQYGLMSETKMDWCSSAVGKLMGEHQWPREKVMNLFAMIWDNQERALLATGNPATRARLEAAYALNTLPERPPAANLPA